MTAQTVVIFGNQTYTYEGLFTLSGPELTKLHNEAAHKVGVEPTKRFSDKLSAAKRTWAVLLKVAAGTEATVATAPSELVKAATVEKVVVPEAERDVLVVKPKALKAEKPAKAPKAPKEKKEAAPRKPRGKRFVFPKGDELKKVREGTFRATLVKMLSREQGATFGQCLGATWGQKAGMDAETAEKTCYEAMRLLHYYCGYGMRHLDQSENPHIQIYF